MRRGESGGCNLQPSRVNGYRDGALGTGTGVTGLLGTVVAFRFMGAAFGLVGIGAVAAVGAVGAVGAVDGVCACLVTACLEASTAFIPYRYVFSQLV